MFHVLRYMHVTYVGDDQGQGDGRMLYDCVATLVHFASHFLTDIPLISVEIGFLVSLY